MAEWSVVPFGAESRDTRRLLEDAPAPRDMWSAMEDAMEDAMACAGNAFNVNECEKMRA